MPESPKVSIIIPTYNEQDNIVPLIERIDRTLSQEFSYEIIVVDDDSPDGTATVAESLSERYPVEVIVRKNARGLASAVALGFKQSKGHILSVIDADLQHPPEAIPHLIKEIDNGADIAICSRYIAGGGITKWGIRRKLSSRIAALSARMVIPVTRDITDPLSGFFALNNKAIEAVNLRPIGYKILLEVLAVGHYHNVAEVPYLFSEREKGETKYGTKEIMRYGQHLLSLAWRTGEIARVFKFMLVGLSGIAVNQGLLYLLTEYAKLFYLISSVVAVQSAILNNFLWNHIWTFSDRRKAKHSILYKLGQFELVSIGGKLTNIAVLYLAVTFLGIQYLIANLLGIAAGFAVNFVANNLWTWRK